MANRLAAMAKGARAQGMNPGRTANYLNVIDKRGRWNNTVFLAYDAIGDPVAWRTGRIIFVNSMSDLFHEDVPLEFVQRVFETMKNCPQHTFQVLTKRPEIAAKFSSKLTWTPNIWLGTSIENAIVTGRIDYLRCTGAAIKFLSVEPLLGPLPRLSLESIDWVIVGGESGPGCRPMELSWVTQIRDRCIARSVPFFFKQWGGANKKAAGRLLQGRTWDQMPKSENGLRGVPSLA